MVAFGRSAAGKEQLYDEKTPHRIKGEKDEVSYMDCLWGELYGSINAHFWAGGMTEEQADYLRKKYLFGDEEDE